MPAIVKWYWDFGDGETSTDKNPSHQYAMSGEYVVTQTITLDTGVVFTTQKSVFWYDIDYSGDVPNASLSNTCYRLPVAAGEGYGVSEYKDNENVGADWVWPPANVQIGKGYDVAKREIALVLDSKTQREYQVNDTSVWTDRASSYDGQTIKSEVHQKAHEANEGEHIPIRHIEHHQYFKSYNRKAFKNATGYDSVGLPLGMRVDNEMYEDEEPIIPAVTTRRIPLNGDIVFNEKVEARNLQLRTIMYGAPFWLTGITPNYETVDKSGTPSLRVMSEDGYQELLSSMPLFHVSRNYNPILNLATGANATGTYTNAITGPDGRAYSALSFGPTDTGLQDTLAAALSGDFTTYMWINGTTIAQVTAVPITLFSFTGFNVMLVENGGNLALRLTYDGAGVLPEVTLNYIGTSWEFIAVVLDGLALKVYEGKELLTSIAIPAQVAQGLAFTVGAANMQLFDACVAPRVITAEAIEYYYDDIGRGGGQVLQPF